MKLPQLRFTVRRLMAAVAVVAIVLATESFIKIRAIELVREHNDDGGWEYIQQEAVMMCVVLNALLFIPIGIGAVMARAAIREHTKGQKRIR